MIEENEKMRQLILDQKEKEKKEDIAALDRYSKMLLETEKKRLLVSTPLNLQGEVFEIPELGNYVPAIMNKTAKSD